MEVFVRFYLIVLLTFLPLSLQASQIKKLKFQTDGEIKPSALYEALDIKLPPWYKFWKDKTPKVHTKIIPLLNESLGYFYKSEGFYNAKVNKIESNSTITFKIDEGAKARISKIIIKSDENIKKLITFKQGDRFRAPLFSEIKKNIKTQMLEKGYCNFVLDTKARVDIEKNSVELIYKLHKNQLCHFGEININTPKNINKNVIRSRLAFERGDRYDLKKINRSYSTISGLEAFDAIVLNTNKKNDVVNVDITLKEKEKNSRIEVGIGYETDIGPRSLFRWEKRNFVTNAKKIAFDFKYSAKEKFARNTLYWPAFVKVPMLKYFYLDLKNDFSYSKIEFNSFNERKYSNLLHLLREYNWFSIDFGLGLQKINIKKLQDTGSVSDGDFNLFFPFIKVATDFRDSRIDPKNGIYLSEYFEIGLDILKESSTYTKSITELRVIKSLQSLTLAAKGKLGLIHEYENHLPESKLFFAGGSFSNRGYGYNSLGSFDAPDNKIGAKTMIDTTLEASHHIYKRINGAIFLDSTLLSKKSNRFSIDFIHSIGTGVRYISPIGPIKFDIAMDINDNTQYAMHFQIGQSY